LHAQGSISLPDPENRRSSGIFIVSLGALDQSGTSVVPSADILSSSSSLDSLLQEQLGWSLDEVDCKGVRVFPWASYLENAPGIAVPSFTISLSDSLSV